MQFYRLELLILETKYASYSVFFFNWHPPENVSRLAPPKFAWTDTPPKFSKCWNHVQVLTLYIIQGVSK